MISSVVTHGSQCKVAPAALLELKAACDLFETAASYGGRAVKFLVSGVNTRLINELQALTIPKANCQTLTSESAEGVL